MNIRKFLDRALFTLGLSFLAGPADAVETVERLEQTASLNLSSLPKLSDWKTLEAWGVQKGEEIDDLFLACVLPQGWTKTPSDALGWSYLIDDKGRNRASIFYSAWPRTAGLKTYHPRFITIAKHSDVCQWYHAIVDQATKTEVWRGPIYIYDWDDDDWDDVTDKSEWLAAKHEQEANDKLAELYPLNKDPLAYWD